jgi:drug/metabolite transporter (DMT)-like permease
MPHFPLTVFLYMAMVGASTYGMLLIKTGLAQADFAQLGLADAVGNIPLVLGSVLYGVGLLLWAAILARQRYSVAVPLSNALVIMATMIAETEYSGEPLFPTRIFGALLIIAGLALVSLRISKSEL